MYDMRYLRCSDCGSDKLVEVVAEGDLTCSVCGLVAMSHMIDTRSVIDECRSMDYYAHRSVPGLCPEVSEFLDTFGIESSCVESHIKELMDHHKSRGYSGSWAVLRAYATYKALKAADFITFNKDLVCGAYGINPSSLKVFDTRSTESDFRIPAIRQRVAATTSMIAADRREGASLANRVEQIDQALKRDPRYASKRPSKMDKVILYYVSVEEGLQPDVDKKQFAKDCDVSMVTFNKHLKLIKELMVGVQAANQSVAT